MLGDTTYHEKNPHLHFSSYSVTKAAVTMANLKFHHVLLIFCDLVTNLIRKIFHVSLKDKGIIFLALNPGWVNNVLAGEDAGQYVSIPAFPKSFSVAEGHIFNSQLVLSLGSICTGSSST